MLIFIMMSDRAMMYEVRPAISVIVPAFNASGTLEETLASIAAQNFDDFEILIIDDGSTDRTREILNRFCEKEPRARLITNPNNQGVAASRNTGLKEAQGKWIALIDADDLWHPDHLGFLFNEVSSSTDLIGLISAAHRRIDTNSRVIFSATPWSIRGYALRQMIYQNFVGNGSAMLVRRSIAIEVGGFDERLREQGVEGCDDFLFQLHVAARYRVAAIPLYTVGYRAMPGSISSDPDRMYRSATLAFKFFQDRHPGIHISSDVLNWHSASGSLVIARYKFSQGYPVEAGRLLVFAISRDPVMTIMMLVHRAFHFMKRRLMRSSITSRSVLPFPDLGPRQGFIEGLSESSWTDRLVSKMREGRMTLISRIDEAEGPYFMGRVDSPDRNNACGSGASGNCVATREL
jgi:glycosyltransferase involved in cell wall biosynthesis